MRNRSKCTVWKVAKKCVGVCEREIEREGEFTRWGRKNKKEESSREKNQISMTRI